MEERYNQGDSPSSGNEIRKKEGTTIGKKSMQAN